jgi:hypothetical protein
MFLALHDDIAAQVRQAYPDARFLDVELGPGDSVRLSGVWSEAQTPKGACRLLYAPREDPEESWRDGPFDLEEVTEDLDRVMHGPYLEEWGMVRAHPDPALENRRWLELPPADRVSEVATVVRSHVPGAEALLMRFESTAGRVAVGLETVSLDGGDTLEVPCARCHPEGDLPWPHDVSHGLALLLCQLYALPHLRRRHLTPCADTTEPDHVGELWQLVLPHRSATTTDSARL